MFKILSIDGGGIRGVIPAKWLERLEEQLGTLLCNHFDMVAGTSTGAVLAAGVAAGIPAKKLLNLYTKHGPDIFPPRGFSNRRRSFFNPFLKPRYEEEPLAEVLQNHFSGIGADPITLSQLKLDTLIVTYDVLYRRPRVLCSWNEQDGRIPVWEACKASCSAPTYFPAHQIELDGVQCPLVDGGVVANNPSSLALAFAIKKQLKGDLKAFESDQTPFLVSMGTGNLTRAISIDEAKQWGTAQWALPILDVLFDGTSSADELVCEAVLSDDAYVRLQVELRIASDDFDDATPQNLNDLQAEAMKYIAEPDGRRNFEKIVEVLKGSSASVVPGAV